MAQLQNDSHIGRLLEELSWEGNARRYRQGGRGLENVLVTEVFAALDLLPREAFLGSILRSAHSGDQARAAAAAGAEDARVEVLPGGPDLYPGGPNIEPDAVLDMPEATVLVEAKRIRAGVFQSEQLAREYLCLFRDFRRPTRLLLLILPGPPPIPVKGMGRLSINEAVLSQLPAIHAKAVPAPPLDDLAKAVDSACAWITWDEIDATIDAAGRQFSGSDASVVSAVRRGATSIQRAIAWHT
jgi:hypothetical protein